MLPKSIKKDGTTTEYHLIFKKGGYEKSWRLGYWSFDQHDRIEEVLAFGSSQEDKTEANARAKMLAYLIENKLIKL